MVRLKKNKKEALAMSLEDIAKEAGISTAAIYKALGEKGNPTIDTLASILKTMGFKLTYDTLTINSMPFSVISMIRFLYKLPMAILYFFLLTPK